jgi:hypothetical protein
LARLTGWIFLAWGALILLKGLWDCFGGQPEANAFSPEPWRFVTRDEWLRYAGFELTYGLACLAIGHLAWRYAGRLPEWVEEPPPPDGA